MPSSSSFDVKRLLSVLFVALVMLAGASGCTSRGMTITSLPEGAEVSINRRVVGITPIRVNFTHYGTYRIELRKERFEAMIKDEVVSPPWYGYDPFTVVADNLIPARINDETYLHYVLKPVGEAFDKESLIARAVSARDGKVMHPRSGKEVIVEMAPVQHIPVEAPQPGANVAPSQPGEAVPLTPKKPNEEKKPAPPRLGTELGLTPPDEPKKEAPKVNENDQKPAPPRLGVELGLTPPEEPKKTDPKPETPKIPGPPEAQKTPSPPSTTDLPPTPPPAPKTPVAPTTPTPDKPKPDPKRVPPNEVLPFDEKK